MNIIFLDIDGPMLPARAWVGTKERGERGSFRSWDPIAVRMINILLKETNAKLVISSTWRFQGREWFEDFMFQQGISPNYLHEDWKTPRENSDLSRRTDEVHMWLKKHPEIDKWVSFDDAYVKGEGAISVSFADGISMWNYNQAREIFGLKSMIVL